MPLPTRLVLTFALVALAGCDQAKAPEGSGRAQGQILPGSASDAMIPLDTIRSQAPLAPQGDSGDGVKAKSQDKSAPKAEAAAPAKAPSAAAEPED